MLSGYLRAITVLIAVAVLLTAAECYGRCSTASCGCHQHSRCPHQPADCQAPAPVIAKACVADQAPAVVAVPSGPSDLMAEPALLVQRDIGSPPAHSLPSISILRI